MTKDLVSLYIVNRFYHDTVRFFKVKIVFRMTF